MIVEPDRARPRVDDGSTACAEVAVTLPVARRLHYEPPAHLATRERVRPQALEPLLSEQRELACRY